MGITYDSATNTITVVGLNGSNPYTFEDIYQADVSNGWGVVSKQGDNQYFINAFLVIGDGATETFLKDTNKQISFDDSVITADWQKLILIKDNATLQFGELINENNFATKNGCALKFPSNYSYYAIRCDGGADNIYSSFLYSNAPRARVNISGRLWNAVGDGVEIYNYGNVSNIYNYTTVNSPRFSFNTIGDIDRAVVNNVPYSKYAIGFNDYTGVVKNVVIHNIELYAIYMNLVAETEKYMIDCELDDWAINWGSNSQSLLRQYSFDPVIVDKNNNTIQFANVKLYDKNNNLIFEDMTNSIGKLSNGVKYITHTKYYWDGSTQTDTTYNPFTLRIIKDGYSTYETKLTIDRPFKDYVFVLDGLIYTYDEIMNELKRLNTNILRGQ